MTNEEFVAWLLLIGYERPRQLNRNWTHPKLDRLPYLYVLDDCVVLYVRDPLGPSLFHTAQKIITGLLNEAHDDP